MAVKSRADLNKKDTYKVKYVKAARAWCETVIEAGKQTQTWSEDRPDAKNKV